MFFIPTHNLEQQAYGLTDAMSMSYVYKLTSIFS